MSQDNLPLASESTEQSENSAEEKIQGNMPVENKEEDTPAEHKQGDAPAEHKQEDAPAEHKQEDIPAEPEKKDMEIKEQEPYVIKVKQNKFPTWGKITIGVASCFLVIYLAGLLYFQYHFMPNSTLNGVEVSMQSDKQVKVLFDEYVNHYALSIVDRQDRELVIDADTMELEYTFDIPVKTVMQQQQSALWFIEAFREKEYAMPLKVVYNEAQVAKEIKTLECLKAENIIEPIEPEIMINQGLIQVKDGDQGCKPVNLYIRRQVEQAINQLDYTVDLDEDGCYEELRYDVEDEAIQQALRQLEQLKNLEITYEFTDMNKVITGGDMLNWVVFDDTYEMELNQEFMVGYLQNMLSDYDLRGDMIDFTTTSGDVVEVKTYLRADQIDYYAEAQSLSHQIMSLLEQGNVKGRRTISDMGLVGDTYIEINLTSQQLYGYKDGELIIETDIVSGLPSTGCATPPGIYSIRYSASPAVLVGDTYRAPVSFWMPFNGGIGLHDATWQSAFGGRRYLTNGSHGCINLPWYMAQAIYQNYGAGDIVVLYHLPGTERTEVTAPSSYAPKKED